MAQYPTRGVELVVPSNAEIAITGRLCGVNFNRRGHDYAVTFWRSGIMIERDGNKVRSWDELPANVQQVIRKSKATADQIAISVAA